MSFSVSPNSAVVMNTSLGEVTVQLYNDMPITTANFLSYVTGPSGANYNGTVFHRIAVNGQTQLQGNTETYSVVQGGGFTNDNGTFTSITENAPIINETTDVHTNSAGTIAMARTSSPDSATSQFFFNVTDNSSVFPDPTAAGPGYTTFGSVIRGMGIVDTIDTLNPTTVGNFSNVPETSSGGFVTINTATEEDTMTINIGPNDAQGTRSLTFMDPLTKAITNISISGGDATIILTGTQMTAKQRGSNLVVSGTNLDLQSISSTDSTAKTNLNINASGGQNYTDIGDINITGSINSINGGNVNLTGGISVSGGVKTIKLLASSAAGIINLDTDNVTGAPATILNIPFLSDISIESNAPIQQLISRQYTVNDGTNRGISAPSINQVHIFGTMNATVQAGTIAAVNVGDLTSLVEANTITSVKLSTMTGGIIYAANAFDAKTLDITRVNVKGAMSSSAQIVSAGNIGNVHLGSMANSDIIAGVDTSALQSANFPSSLASNATLSSVGISSKKKNISFSNSQIASYQINALHLGRISTHPSGGTTTGVQAHILKSLTATTDKNQSLHLSNITSPAALSAALTRSGVNLNPGTTVGTLSSALASGKTFTTINLKTALSSALTAGSTINLVSGSQTQSLTLAVAAKAGDHTLTVNSFVANANYPVGANLNQPGTGFTIDMI